MLICHLSQAQGDIGFKTFCQAEFIEA